MQKLTCFMLLQSTGALAELNKVLGTLDEWSLVRVLGTA